MKRIIGRLRMTVAALVLVALTVAAAAALAGPTTFINVTFSADGRSATITSGKDISHYTVTLCTGTLAKVEAVGDSLGRTEDIGPFASQIVSVQAKAGQTNVTITNANADCSHDGDHDGDDDHDGGDHDGGGDHGGEDHDGDGDHDADDHHGGGHF